MRGAAVASLARGEEEQIQAVLNKLNEEVWGDIQITLKVEGGDEPDQGEEFEDAYEEGALSATLPTLLDTPSKGPSAASGGRMV